jgi:hypothetical protein
MSKETIRLTEQDLSARKMLKKQMREHADKIRKLSGAGTSAVRTYSRKLNQTMDGELAKNKISMVI